MFFLGKVTNLVRPVAKIHGGRWWDMRLERNAVARTWRTWCARLKHGLLRLMATTFWKMTQEKVKWN